MLGLVSSINFSRSFCSSALSVSLAVEMMCCATTIRQARPDARRALDDSSSRVEIVDDIGQSRDCLDQFERDTIKPAILIFDPLRGDGIATPDDGIKRAIKPHEQDGQLEIIVCRIE